MLVWVVAGQWKRGVVKRVRLGIILCDKEVSYPISLTVGGKVGSKLACGQKINGLTQRDLKVVLSRPRNALQ